MTTTKFCDSKSSCRALILIFCAGLLAGCSSSRQGKYQLPEEAIVAQAPLFLTGAVAVLLTNANSFSAHVTIEPPAATNLVHASAGLLLGFGSQLIFAPKESDKTYIWDVRRHSGFVLSEALQGYAPISSPFEITNVITISETAASGLAVVNAHPGHEAEISVAANDGSTNVFSVWRASDFREFPVRIKVINGPLPYVINFSLLKSENLDAKLFQPPDGFTKYPNAGAIASELLMRKTKMRSSGSADFNRPPAAAPPRGY